jgi:molybdopterin synthase catalytic subunit
MPPVAVTPDPLDLQALIAEIAGTGTGDGAIVSFAGLVREQNQGRRVSFLEYEAYEPLAVRALQRIVDEARDAWPAARLGVHHRIGRLELGEASIVIVSAAAHRADAFAACRYTIERVKQIVPIWKHEHFDGGDVWLEGATADPDDEAARQAAHRIACCSPGCAIWPAPASWSGRSPAPRPSTPSGRRSSPRCPPCRITSGRCRWR